MPRDIEEYRKEVDARTEQPERPICLQNNSWWDIKMSRYEHMSRLQEHRKSIARNNSTSSRHGRKRASNGRMR